VLIGRREHTETQQVSVSVRREELKVGRRGDGMVRAGGAAGSPPRDPC